MPNDTQATPTSHANFTSLLRCVYPCGKMLGAHSEQPWVCFPASSRTLQSAPKGREKGNQQERGQRGGEGGLRRRQLASLVPTLNTETHCG
jgi:hypothetical protein